MYELIQAGKDTYYFDCPAKIGLYVAGGDAYLIDSGNDRDAGKRVLRALNERGLQLKAILNTHSHADHIGGNAYLQKQTGCRVYACGIEAAFTRWPVLEPALLYGACPPNYLRHKFLMAEGADVRPVEEAALPEGLTVFPLPGHAPDMVGVRTPDDVVFLADSLTGEQTLRKYRIPYVYDVAAHLRTLAAVEELQGALFVPAHAPAAQDIRPLAQLNQRNVHETAELLLGLLKEPMGFDRLLGEVFSACGLTMTYEQHALVGSTVRAYLAWLTDEGALRADIESNALVWRAQPR